MKRKEIKEIKEADELFIKIGKNVKKYRECNGISQLELSIKLNYKSVSVISNPEIYYKQKYKFNIEQLFLISKVLNVPIENFFK